MQILAIETSCDETAAAVVEDGCKVRSNVIASQVAVHRVYRGVVPELASRAHLEYIIPVIDEALRIADCGRDGSGIDAVAVTRGPGLVGALLVGIEVAKTLSLRWQKPLIATHHLMGHLHSIFCELPEGKSRLLMLPDEEQGTAEWQEIENQNANMQQTTDDFSYPFLALIVSGGHSNIMRVNSPSEVKRLGSTLDDAPGEAYDKVAKCLGLPYPGGPEVDKRAALGDASAFKLPRPILRSHALDFSFSGLKTAVVQLIQKQGGVQKIRADETLLNNICASFQDAVIDVLLTKSQRALQQEGLQRLAVVGGVACNRGLRKEARSRLSTITLAFPMPVLCTDNAAMIGAAAAHITPLDQQQALVLDARSGWPLG